MSCVKKYGDAKAQQKNRRKILIASTHKRASLQDIVFLQKKPHLTKTKPFINQIKI